MAQEFSSSELCTRTFTITMAGIGLFIAAVFLFVL
jgi:hypothetical protein